MKQRRERGGIVNEEDEENASEYEIVPPPKPLRRISTFLGGHELDRMTQEDRRRLLRKAPYRTISTDAAPLEFVSPSEVPFVADRRKNRRNKQRRSSDSNQVGLPELLFSKRFRKLLSRLSLNIPTSKAFDLSQLE
jgi:hypothetical protein